MFARMIRPCASAVVVVVALTACDRPASPAGGNPAAGGAKDSMASASAVREVSTIHWLGKQRLAADPNATNVMSLWNLPESVKLGQQTLDKLALAPWRMLKGDAATNGAPIALLRPLLDDLVEAESLWTFYHPTNGEAGCSLAIRLPPEHASLWHTNLAAIFESLTGAKPEAAAGGFSLHAPSNPPIQFVARHSNDWTLVQFGTPAVSARDLELPAATGDPGATNWLSFSIDLARLNRAFALGWALPANCPRVEAYTTGDGVSVASRANLDFATPPALTLEPWNIPTNLIHDPLTSFVACRAAGPLLESLPIWSKLDLGAAPAQFYLWSQAGLPFQTYVAAPVSDVSNRLASLSRRLISANSWLGTNGLGWFTNREDGQILWADLMIMEPWLASSPQPGGDWFAGGFFGVTRTNRPAPVELLAQFQSSPSIVYYDWEITEDRVTDWLYLGQLLRLALLQAQVPPESAALKWLNVTGAQLGNCGTVVQQQAPGHFTFSRRSSLGLSAAELHLLVDWLESPRFPSGLSSVELPPEDITRRNIRKMATMKPSPATNSPATNSISPP